MAEYLAAAASRERIPHRHRAREVRLPPRGSRPPPYEPADGQPGNIRDLLRGLAACGGAPILDGDNAIGVKQGAASISLEPAGQLELSGAPVRTLHETKQELDAHFADVRSVCRDLDMGFAPLGFHPTGDARTCRGCRRAAMPSCGATCRWWAAWGWT
jgi:gamma-glutamylcysteine synthetase